MKIALVSQSYHPRTGGVTENVHHTAAELRRRGHEVTVVTANFGRTATERGVERMGRNVLIPVNSAWVNMTVGFDLFGDLKRVFARLDPDIIHTHNPLTPTLPLLTLHAAPAHVHVVGTFHAAAESNTAYRLFQPYLRRMAERIDTRIAVSRPAIDFASKYFPGDYTIVPNGIDCERFRPNVEPIDRFRDDKFNILFVGRLDKRKGVRYLYRATALASRRATVPIRLIVVGDNGVRAHLQPSLPKNVELVLTGVVSNERLPHYFASADIFCSPAIERESFGIVLLEAMASGVPLVGTGIAGYLTLLRDRWNSIVVPPRNAEALATAILELMDQPALRWRLRENGLKFAQLYRWERIVDQLEKIYRREETPAWSEPEPALGSRMGA